MYQHPSSHDTCPPPFVAPAFCSQGTSSLRLQQRQRRRRPLLANSSSCKCAMSRTSPALPCLPAPMAAEARAPHPLRWRHAPSTFAMPCAATRPLRPPPWILQGSFLRALPLSRPNQSSQDLPRWLCMVSCTANTVCVGYCTANTVCVSITCRLSAGALQPMPCLYCCKLSDTPLVCPFVPT